MKKKHSVIIFTDLDGTLLNRDTFKFDEIKDYIKSLVREGIIIIPNTSKTQVEIEDFNKKLDLNLPFISENGSAIFGLDNINKNFPNNIVLSKLMDKDEEFSYELKLNYNITAGNAGNILVLIDGDVRGKIGKYGDIIDSFVLFKDFTN